jgi:hypothetical protein
MFRQQILMRLMQPRGINPVRNELLYRFWQPTSPYGCDLVDAIIKTWKIALRASIDTFTSKPQ